MTQKVQSNSSCKYGITEYMPKEERTNTRISGYIKHKSEDFVVVEIDKNNNLVENSVVDEKLFIRPVVDTDDDKKEQLYFEFVDLLKINQVNFQEEQLKELLLNNNRNEKVLLQSEKISKEKEYRKVIHSKIKEINSKVESNFNDNKEIEMQISNKKIRREKKDAFYCCFTLEKNNVELMKLVSIISNILKVNNKCFEYSGTKDKKALTRQKISAFCIEPKRLYGINKILKEKAKISNFEIRKEGLKLGDLFGNRFTILIREAVGDIESFEKELCNKKNIEFVNYFGLQRFGNNNNQEIGHLILKKEYKLVVQRILGTEDLENKENLIELKNTTRCVASKQIISALLVDNKNYLSCIQKISRNNKLMFVHSYQSVLWNRVCSYRIANFGLRLQVGDIVKLPNTADIIVVENESVRDSLINDHEDIVQYIVIPLFGNSVTYPKIISSELAKMLEADGLDINFSHPVKDFDLSGDYRYIISSARDFNYKFIKYESNDQTINVEDVLNNSSHQYNSGSLTGLIVNFSLHKGCYATMALRELINEKHSQ